MRQITKQELREKILTLLRNQKEEERLTKSLVIKDRLFALQEFQKAKTILFYVPFDGEVDTFEMMRQAKQFGKKIALPRIVRHKKEIIPKSVDDIQEDLEEGPYGIAQPKEATTRTSVLEDIDLVIVPGVAFDKQNYRLGRGEGYYDRFLSKLPERTPTIGLAFGFQMIDHLPQKAQHDVPLTQVLVN